MREQNQNLMRQIKQIYGRWKKTVLLKGAAMSVLIALGALLFVFALDAWLEVGNSIRLLLLVGAAGLTVATVVYQIVRPLRKAPSATQLARYVEEKHPELEDRFVSAVELSADAHSGISPLILEKLIDDTRQHIKSMNLLKTVSTKNATIWSSLALAVLALCATVIFSHLSYFLARTDRIFTPWKIPTFVAQTGLKVTPGDARVAKGSSQEIRAEVNGLAVDQATLYFSLADTTWRKVPMDKTSQDGAFVYNFFDIQGQTKYYVKADNLLSKIYTFTTYEAPEIKRVDLTYQFPEYTGLKPKKEIDTGDIWAPEGTIVRIKAVSDKPLQKGEFILGDHQKLNAAIKSDTLITATITVDQDTYYKIRITDTDLLTNDPPPEYFVHAIPDQAPILTIASPGRDLKASMVEEVPVKINVQDDFGLKSLKLFYTVNGDKEQTVNLTATPEGKEAGEVQLNQLRSFQAEHLFYLEDMQVQPGDFLTYYVQALDNRAATMNDAASTDIYFLDIRPFEREFYRPVSQGEASGSGGNALGGQLSSTQKEIIVATWKLAHRQKKISEDELQENLAVLVESQSNLKEVTENTLFQMQQRSMFTRKAGERVTELYSQAAEAMERALDQLKQGALDEALKPERQAYQSLRQAEAQLKEFQMQMAQSQGGSGSASLEDLARLFEDDMDKLKNKYETLQQNQRRQKDQAVNEALEKVKELARRQQQLNKRARDLARNQLEEQEKKRRIEELRRQQEQIQREMQQLNRPMQQIGQNDANLSREMQNSLRQASSEMNNASNDLRKENSDLAAAKGQKALSRLKHLENALKRNLNESLRREYESLMQELQQLREAQKQLTNDVESLARGENADKELLQKAREDQSQLKDDVSELQKDLQALNRKSQKSEKKISRDLTRISREFQNSRFEDKMQSAQDLLQKERLNSALQAERDIQTMLERFEEKMSRLRRQLADTKEEKLELALDQTQKLRESLESLQQQSRTEAGQGQALQKGSQPQTRGQQGNRDLAGPGESKSPPPKLSPEQREQWNEALARAAQDLQAINQSIQVDSTLSRQLGRINNDLQGIVRNFGGGDPKKLDLIENKLLGPLRSFETELAQTLELLQNKERLFLAREEKIPPEYEELVEKYYEALSKSK
ncbi:MAG: DUF4175 family protein [bacterium]